MHPLRAGHRWALLGAALVALGLAYANPFPLLMLANLKTGVSDAHPVPTAQLSRYRVEVEARPILGLTQNLSGLTFNEDTGSLFGVVNRPAAIVEISVDGQLLRHERLPGLRDAEGITHIERGRFLVSDEHDNSLHLVEIGRDSRIATSRCLQKDEGPIRNLGIEGLSWDQERKQLLVAQEKWPKQVLVLQDPFPCLGGQGSRPAAAWPVPSLLGLPGSDLSSLTTDPRSGHLLLVHQEVAALSELDRHGHVVDYLLLWAGHGGLAQRVPQAEGIAMGPAGVLFLVSEPNLFYRFRASSLVPG